MTPFKPPTVPARRNDEALVTIATFPTEFEASLARGALEAIGIPSLVPAEARGSFRGLYNGIAPSTAELKVFESDRDRAVVELRRLQIRVVDPPK
jgi:hypothetical protein